MRSTDEHKNERPIMKSVFKMVNLVSGLEPEIIQYTIKYDQKLKRGTLEAKDDTTSAKEDTKTLSKIHQVHNGKIEDAFPIPIIDHRFGSNGWKVRAEYRKDAKGATKFELIVNDKNFYDYEYLEISGEEQDGVFRNEKEHKFEGNVKKSVFIVVYTQKNKDREKIIIEVSYQRETKTGILEVFGANSASKHTLQGF